MDARMLYRRLYRELSYQALEASKVQTAQLKRREAALAAYRKRLAEQKQAQAEGRDVVNPSPALSKRLKAGPLYDSKALRECFTGAAKDPKQTLEYGQEVWEYLRSQRTYKDLLARYNPGATMDDEERIRLSAQRVGLALPKTMREQLDIIY
uniref:ARAD1D43318p n=1 Tax=Blastobotrys adeninivorans TaxID=409370 RepID=A0A060TCY7_BLAAD